MNEQQEEAEPDKVVVRAETAADHAAVHAINTAAFTAEFGSDAEAGLVERLRAKGAASVSLVAELDGTVVGHILFSPATIEGEHGTADALGLAPMAVTPGLQRSGIGSALINKGLECCVDLGATRIIVLGHPDYYPRFGFKPASGFGIKCEYEVPDELFMARELAPGAFDGVSGLARYHEEFGAL